MNVDPANNPPGAESLAALGVRVARYVLREGVTDQYEAECVAANVMTLGVCNQQSGGYMGNAIWREITNEPNNQQMDNYLPAGGDDPDVYLSARLKLFRATYPDAMLIAGGLVCDDGTLSYVKAVMNDGGYTGYQAVGLHYPPSATICKQVASLTGLPVWITEWHWPAAIIPSALGWMKANSQVQIPFCAGDWMVPGFGFLDHPEMLQTWLAFK